MTINKRKIALLIALMLLPGVILAKHFTLVVDAGHGGRDKGALGRHSYEKDINLAVALILFVGSVIPGTWGESYVEGSQGVINSALDNTFGGTWYVLLGSTVAFVASAFVNNFINWSIGKALKDKKDNFFAFALRTYVSTAVGQFVDNLIFAFIVSLNFFGWSPLQCVTCALTGMVAELLFEIVFSHLGYLICKKWKKDNVGEAYFALRAQKEQTV